jgi:putative FmdB family regulatory protein
LLSRVSAVIFGHEAVIFSGDAAGSRDERLIPMPTYDYRCTRCGDEFSTEQSMLDKPLRKCKKCGGRLEKLLPKSLNLIFKGSGFYSTDYRKPDANRPRSESEKQDSAVKETVKKAAEKKSAGEKTAGEKSPGEKSA